MTVRHLCELLDVETYGDVEVSVRCHWHGEAPAHDRWEIAYLTESLEPDTAERVVTIECRQDG